MSNSERGRLAEEFSKAYLNDIACDDLSFSRSIDIEIGFEAGYDAGVESEKKKARGLVEALEKLDQRLCEGIFDPCRYDPLKEDKLSLVITVRASSDDCEWMLSKVRQALSAYKQESEGGE